MIILDKNSLSRIEPGLIKKGFFYTTFDCINYFSRPGLEYSQEERSTLRENIKFLSENNRIVITRDTPIRKDLEEYIEGFYPLLTTYNLKERGNSLYIPTVLREDVAFLVDCILVGLANKKNRVIIVTENKGIEEIFNILTISLSNMKNLISPKKGASDFLDVLTNDLNLSICTDLREIGQSYNA
jgi:hypothetical protein